MGVELWMSYGGEYLTGFNQTTNTIVFYPRSETVRDKLHSREGNSPDPQLRPLNVG